MNTLNEQIDRRAAARAVLLDGLGLLLAMFQVATVLLVAFAAIPFVLQLFTGTSTNIVLTGSMSGTAEPGDLIQTQPYLGQTLTVGTIVGVDHNGTRYTHRIVEVIADDGGSVTYATKGDANDTRDLFRPSRDEIWGVATNIVHQPLALFLTRFAWNGDWTETFMAAAMAGDLDAVGALMPTAPWGLLILVAAIILFWWILPDALAALRARSDRRHAAPSDALDESIEFNAADPNPEFVTRSPFERHKATV